jgi:hypothetical protein
MKLPVSFLLFLFECKKELKSWTEPEFNIIIGLEKRINNCNVKENSKAGQNQILI